MGNCPILTMRALSKQKDLDWLDRKMPYVIDGLRVHPLIKREILQDINLITWYAPPLWMWREIYRAWRHKPSWEKRWNIN